MPGFKSANSYWDFARSVKFRARFMHTDEVQDFLKTVIETSESRLKTLEKGRTLARAQRGSEPRLEGEGEDEFYVDGAYSPERMKPKAELVGDGRVNPRGIPCLYLAGNPETAMAEVRPWLGSYISVAQFKVMRDCKIVDCSMDKKIDVTWVWTATGDIKKREIDDRAGIEAKVWGDIAEAFSKPVDADEPHIEYVPTQVLAEAFRRQGYDGIVYKSLLNGEGVNIALFDLEAADLMNCGLYKASSVSFEFEQVARPYFRGKHYLEPKDERGEVESSGGRQATSGMTRPRKSLPLLAKVKPSSLRNLRPKLASTAKSNLVRQEERRASWRPPT
jgi:hypothetical protein